MAHKCGPARAAATFLAHPTCAARQAAAAEQSSARARVRSHVRRERLDARAAGVWFGVCFSDNTRAPRIIGRSRVNRGGVWSYVEKPGWDFQASSHRPWPPRRRPSLLIPGAVVPWAAPGCRAGAVHATTASRRSRPYRYARGDADGLRRRPRRNRRPRDPSAGLIGSA